MSAERTVVCTLFPNVSGEGNIEEFYQREIETSGERGKSVVSHGFTTVRSEAAIFTEPIGLAFAERLQKGWASPIWLIDLATGRRIDLAQPEAPAAETLREAVRVCLDESATPESKWYIAHPTATSPQGKKWYIRCSPPGLEQQILYDDSPTAVVERAAAIRTNVGGSLLDWAERAPTPTASELGIKPEVQNSTPSYRVRPGEMR